MTLSQAQATANFLRYKAGSRKGHYESFFLRANHPTEPQAFWVRYTLFIPKGDPELGKGELWAIFFEGDQHRAAKLEIPIELCFLPENLFQLEIGGSTLMEHRAVGHIRDEMRWELNYRSQDKPLFLLPINWYSLPFPKAKSLVPMPFANFDGKFIFPDKTISFSNWVGSQNHNWGSQHTDRYAWGQVVGFDNQPDSMLEIATASIKIAGVHTPKLTAMVLRHRGHDYVLNGWVRGFMSKAAYDYFCWDFESENSDTRIKGRIEAPASAFVGLRYPNPPGGNKYCLNSKIASCEITFTNKKLGVTEQLYTQHRCAFEILTDDAKEHGLKILF